MNTKLKSLTVVLLLFTILLSAQDFQGIATYHSNRKINMKIKEGSKNYERDSQIQAQLQKQFQKEFTLTFNKEESIYKENKKLDAPTAPPSSGIQIKIPQSSDVLYKNIKENRYTNKTELMGKRFLIQDSIASKNWELINETKAIGKYTCYKAQFSEEIETQNLSPEGEIIKEMKERITTAWYTPQIPVSNGPSDFGGLPGLILEINDGKRTLICSKISLNKKDKTKIEEPTKGKKTSQAVFDKVQKKKEDEMMERFKTKNNNKKGNTTTIFIGG